MSFHVHIFVQEFTAIMLHPQKLVPHKLWPKKYAYEQL